MYKGLQDVVQNVQKRIGKIVQYAQRTMMILVKMHNKQQ